MADTSTPRIDYELTETYTITDTIIGPTTDTTERPNSSLPNTLSAGGSDATTIYLDVTGGNDSDSGFTLALAKLTLTAAYGALTVTRTTIHIENTGGTHSDLDFSGILSDNNCVNIQCAAGQTATIRGLTPDSVIANAGNINGIEFIRDANADGLVGGHFVAWSHQTGAGSGVSFLMRHCSISAREFPLHCVHQSDAPLVDIQKSIIKTTGNPNLPAYAITNYMSDCDATGRLRLVNVVIHMTGAYGNVDGVGGSASVDSSGAIVFNGSGYVNTPRLLLENVTFVTCPSLIVVNDQANIVPTVVTFDACIIHQCGRLGANDGVLTPSGSITGSLINTNANGWIDTTATDNLFNRDPLFLSGSDFRLMHVGRTFNGVPYPLTSPAFDPLASPPTMGAYEIAATLVSQTMQSFFFTEDMGFERVTWALERINYEQFQDILGLTRDTWDAERWRITMDLDGRYWVGSDFSMDLTRVVKALGVKRFYPNGDVGVIGPRSWVYTSGPSPLVLTLTLPRNFRVNWWRNWRVNLSWEDPISTTRVAKYKVLSNTATTVTLEYVSGDVVAPTATGTRRIAIQYIPVIIDMDNLELVGEYYTHDEEGGTLFIPFYKLSDTDTAHEFHTRKIVMRESIDADFHPTPVF